MKARSARTPVNSREEIRAGLRYLWHLPRAGGGSASLSCHLIHSDTASSCSPPPVRIWWDFPLNTQQHIDVIASAEAIMWQPAFVSGFVDKINWKSYLLIVIKFSGNGEDFHDLPDSGGTLTFDFPKVKSSCLCVAILLVQVTIWQEISCLEVSS